MNVLSGGGDEEQGLVQVAAHSCWGCCCPAEHRDDGQGVEHEPLQSGMQTWAKTAVVIYLWFEICGAAEGRETLMGNIVWPVLPLLCSLKLGALPGRLKNAGANKIIKNSENKHNNL